MIDDQDLIENDSPFASILIITDYHAIKIMVIYLKILHKEQSQQSICPRDTVSYPREQANFTFREVGVNGGIN